MTCDADSLGGRTPMARLPQRFLLLATMLVVLGMAAAAQSQQDAAGVKKPEKEKTSEPAKTKDKDASKPNGGNPKLPPGTIIMTAEDVQKSLPFWPKTITMRWDEWQALQDQVNALKQQLKGDRRQASSCELTAKLEAEYIALRAEFAFSTESPRANVVLGMQGAQLTEKADLDGSAPLMDYTADEGFIAR